MDKARHSLLGHYKQRDNLPAPLSPPNKPLVLLQARREAEAAEVTNGKTYDYPRVEFVFPQDYQQKDSFIDSESIWGTISHAFYPRKSVLVSNAQNNKNGKDGNGKDQEFGLGRTGDLLSSAWLAPYERGEHPERGQEVFVTRKPHSSPVPTTCSKTTPFSCLLDVNGALSRLEFVLETQGGGGGADGKKRNLIFSQ